MDGLFVITGGGTGGHLFPGLAVAFEARRREPDQRILYVSRESAEEQERVEQHGFEFKGLTVRGLSRRRIHRNVKILYEHAKATLQMKGILSASARGAVLGVGGYASAPAVLAARLARWPIVLHEQNSFPGVVTRWFSKHAAAVCTSFEESHPHLEGPKPVLTGMPVRPEIQPPDNWSRGQDIKKPPCILVLGGSQGARALVKTVLDSIDHLDERNIEFRMILQTGQQNRDLVQGLPERGQIVTPATIGWNIVRSSWRPRKYHGAFDGLGVWFRFDSWRSGAFTQIENRNVNAVQASAATNSAAPSSSRSGPSGDATWRRRRAPVRLP